MSSKKLQTFEVKIDKLVHGGQGLGVMDDGRKAFVWGVLPEEIAQFVATKNKKDYAEGVATKLITRSKHRIRPIDEHYLSSSPWQIMDYEYENQQKLEILSESIKRQKLEYSAEIKFYSPKKDYRYRSKMEYSFYGDEQGLHLALYNRGTHSKQIIKKSHITSAEIDKVAGEVCKILDEENIRAGELKSIVLRSNSKSEVVCALYVKREDFPKIEKFNKVAKGLAVVYSNPKSPASLRTKDLHCYGDISLSENLLGKYFKYSVFSFFQVNTEAFEMALKGIKQEIGTKSFVDMYCGVGAIGLSVGKPSRLVESDRENVFWAIKNSGDKNKVKHVNAEQALEYINDNDILILDPPRAGMHTKLIDKINEVLPPKLIYLSCNPSTQVRDLELLSEKYNIQKINGYNFFPRTPHIESLAIIVRK